MIHLRHREPRRGAIAILVALLLVAFMGFVAMAVDIGYIAVVKGELQNTADAAALAGASQLLNPAALQGPTNQSTAMSTAMANARTQAQAISSTNKGGNVSLVLDANTSNSATGDIVCGYWANPRDTTSRMIVTTPGVGPYPNAVQVRVHRDSTRNGSLSLFFARVLGRNTQDLDATATAIYDGRVLGFKIQSPGYTTCKLLPFALDVTAWNSVVAGIGPDEFSRNATTGAVTAGSDGIKECKLFPLSNGNGGDDTSSGLPPGNFGTVDIGASNNSTSDLARQILYGPNASDLAYFPNGELKLDSTTGTLTVEGDTGVSAGVKGELASIIGQPRIIPIYSSVSGPGNNAKYTIVAFAGVTVTEVDLTGSLSSKHMTIQPCFVIDPNVLTGSSSSTSSYNIVKPLGLAR